MTDQPRRRYLSMPDPCPHITRLDIIAAKVNGETDPDLRLHLD